MHLLDLKRVSLRFLFLNSLLIASLLGCATLPKPKPDVESTLAKADAALGAISEELQTFQKDLSSLLSDIHTLYSHPGWSEMEVIVLDTVLVQDSRESESDEASLEEALEEWSSRWGTSGESLYLRYLALADRCSAMEMRRINLAANLAAIQATYLEATLMELDAQREDQARLIFQTLEAVGKAEDELNSYRLNETGLYNTSSHH